MDKDKCKYFKGEKENPFTPDDVKSVFWECEKRWLNATESHKSRMLDQYSHFGLDDHKKNDGTPMTLKAEILNWHYQHGGDYETAKGFIDLYKAY